MSQYTSSSISTLHTTLAQDAFRLYYGVIDHVIDNVRRDLKESGKTDAEANEIASKLEKKWRENLEQSQCIDQQNMMGIRAHAGINNNIDNNNNNYDNNSNMGYNSNDGSMMGSMDQLQNNDMMSSNSRMVNLTGYGNSDYSHGIHGSHAGYGGHGAQQPNSQHYTGVHSQGPPRKRARIQGGNNNNNNSNNSNIQSGYNNLQGPSVIQPTYPASNPHIQGMGVPTIDQVPNPFENASRAGVNSSQQAPYRNYGIPPAYQRPPDHANYGQRDGANDNFIENDNSDNDNNTNYKNEKLLNNINSNATLSDNDKIETECVTVNDNMNNNNNMNDNSIDMEKDIIGIDNIKKISKDKNGITTVVLNKPIRMQFKIPQADGPMMTNVKGFSDDEDDDDNNNNNNNNSNRNNNNNGNNSNNTSNTSNNANNNNSNSNNGGAQSDEPIRASLMYNGRDLNAPLNSEDDDSCEEQDLEINDIIRCQYSKVNRKKSEWKVELKNGIMHIDHKDYAFLKAQNGTFKWETKTETDY